MCVCGRVEGGRSQLPGSVLEVLSFSACVGDPSVCPCVCVCVCVCPCVCVRVCEGLLNVCV